MTLKYQEWLRFSNILATYVNNIIIFLMQHGLISAKTKFSESNIIKINVIFTSTSVLLKKKASRPPFVFYWKTTPRPSMTSLFSIYRLPPTSHWPVSGPSGRHDQVPDRHTWTPGPDGEGDRPGDDQQQIQVAGRKNAQGLELLHKLGRKLVWDIIIICIIIRVIVQREVLKVWLVFFYFHS